MMSGSAREEKPSSTSNFCCHYTGAAPRPASLQSGLPECPQSWRSVLSSINHQTLMTRNEWSVISGMYHSNGRSCNCDVRTHSGSWCKLGFLRNTILCIIIQLSWKIAVFFTWIHLFSLTYLFPALTSTPEHCSDDTSQVKHPTSPLFK